MKLIVFALILLGGVGLSVNLTENNLESVKEPFNAESGVTDVLIALGEKAPYHYIESRGDTTLIRQGMELATLGKTIGPDGKMTSRQSKYFTCTDCHNFCIEDPDLRVSDPEGRLTYAVENNIPFLSGSTMYGIVNREHWYNQDYQKKYGSLVLPARDSLLNAIHLCTVECSQGRPFEDWELKAFMTYLYSIEYKLGDLGFTQEDYDKLNNYTKGGNNEELIGWLKSFYYTASPATFLSPIPVAERKLGEKGNPENGKELYNRSCMHCHQHGKVTNYNLDENVVTFKSLKRSMGKYNHGALYNIVRKGTYALPGYRPYMPNYTLERMSHQQLEDLAAYINQQSN